LCCSHVIVARMKYYIVNRMLNKKETGVIASDPFAALRAGSGSEAITSSPFFNNLLKKNNYIAI
jgi:hypothetical protein